MRLLLDGGFSVDGSVSAEETGDIRDPQSNIFDEIVADANEKKFSAEKDCRSASLFRETNVEALVKEFAWLGVAVDVAKRERFVHFDLIFSDVMRARGGFDLIVGNPPWLKPIWNEGLVLADIDPLHDGLTAAETKKILYDAIAKAKGEERFLQEFVSTRGTMEATSSEVMNPFAGGGANNLYRCFVDLSFRLVAPTGCVALIHQDSHLGDPRSGEFRGHWYTRVARHFEFSNKLSSKTFAEVDSNLRFSLNIYRGISGDPEFLQYTHAFSASQVDEACDDKENSEKEKNYSELSGIDEIPAMRTPEGEWDTRGHRDRVLLIDRESLTVIHSLSEEDNVPVLETRFIQPWSTHALEVFRQMARFRKLDAVIPKIKCKRKTATGERTELVSQWQQSRHWDETGAQKNGTIKRETGFQPAQNIILQGPHFHVGNPLYKSAKRVSRTSADYDVVDLTEIPEDYLPRTNYRPALDYSEYSRRVTRCNWDITKNHADFFRVVFRNMISLDGERSLISALIPPKSLHVNTAESVAFGRDEDLLILATISSSIPYDFLVKASGIGHFFNSFTARLPWIDVGWTACHRALRLNCLTTAYADLWNRCAGKSHPLPWSSHDPRLNLEGPVQGPVKWNCTAGLRTDFARRLALVEIDVLVAQALGLTFDQLKDIYRVHFPVLQKNEAGTWFDQAGKIVWTCSMGLPGIGWLDENGKRPGRAAWNQILDGKPSELICSAIDDTMPGGPREVERRFEGPFTTCDRIEDYKRAWEHFERHKSDEAGRK